MVADVAVEVESWVWIDRTPSTDEMLERLRSLPDQFGLSVADYADYVLPLSQRQKMRRDGREEYVETWRLYMTVAGRVVMLRDAALKHGWSVEESWEAVSTDPFVLRCGLRVSADGAVVGVRFGLAKAKGGDTAWEKMETAARGRAIAAWGIGVLPGSGIASLEEMQDAMSPQPHRDGKEKRDAATLLADTMAAIEELRQFRGQEPAEIAEKIAEYVHRHLGVQVPYGETVDLSGLKKGQLALLERNVRSQLAKEMEAQAPV